METFVTNAIKKTVKQLREEYVKLTEKSKKGTKNTYKGEPTEELYKGVVLIPEGADYQRWIGANSKGSKYSKLSLDIPCSSKHSRSNNSQDDLLESSGDSDSTRSSLDSGLSKTPPELKKHKKLQFASEADKVHVFEPNTLETGAVKEPHLSDQSMEVELCRTKIFDVPSPQKVKIISQEFKKSSEDRLRNENTSSKAHDKNNCNNLPAFPNDRLRINYSLDSPKSNHEAFSEFVGHNPHNAFYRQNLAALPKCPPEKPPRLASGLRKASQDSLSINAFYANRRESTFLKSSLMEEDGYSVPFDINEEDLLERSSTPKKKYYNESDEHIYAEIVSKSSGNLEETLYSPTDSKEPKHVYAQVTPRASRYLEQYFPSTQVNALKSQRRTDLAQNLTRSESHVSCAREISSVRDAKYTTENCIFSQECRDRINMIHKINWSLKTEDVIQKHDCRNKNKKPEDLCLEEKFVVNMFQSRPSKRWEKHVRDIEANKDQDEKFEKNVWKRLSLDSRKQKAGSVEEKLRNRSFNNNLWKDDKLESLEELSKKIQRELKRLEEEDIDAFSKTLEKEKHRIESHLILLNNNEDQTSIHLRNESRRILTDLEQIEAQRTEEYNKYKELKKFRNVQCIRMSQASKALEEIRSRRGKKDWLEVLIAEKTLLETSEKVQLLTQEIRDNTYSVIPEPPLHKGTIHLREIKFHFDKEFRGNCKRDKNYTEFFVISLSYRNQIFISEFITGEIEPLIFPKNYTFEDVLPDFEIKVRLFCLKLRTFGGHFWDYFTFSNFCPTSRIIYEDLLTQQFQEKTVYKTSFKLCAEATLTKSNINEYSTRLKTIPEVFCKLESHIQFNLKCDDIDVVANLTGFLDVGTVHGETYYWERKWCVLNGSNLMIYNYPQEEDFGKPFEQINLEYCFGSIVTKVENCPKKRTFHLRTGRPNDINHPLEVHTLKTKPNFTLRKFYFAASNMEEYLQWTVEVEKILNSLSDFKKLAFGEEYVEYMKM